MHILVIGGTRFMGPSIIRQLHEQGHSITLFHRGQTQAELPSGVQEILADRAHLPEFRTDLRNWGIILVSLKMRLLNKR